jgi:hypothetical protein
MRPADISCRRGGASPQRQSGQLPAQLATSARLGLCRANFPALQSVYVLADESAFDMSRSHPSKLSPIGSVLLPFAPVLPSAKNPPIERLEIKQCLEAVFAGGFVCRRTCNRGDQECGVSSSDVLEDVKGLVVELCHGSTSHTGRKLTICATANRKVNNLRYLIPIAISSQYRLSLSRFAFRYAA